MTNEAPDGAAVFPMIPPELGVHPLLLAALHGYVFLEGSDEEIVQGDAAEESMQYMVTYLQRLKDSELKRVREDFAALVSFGKSEDWPKQQIRFLQDFLKEIGIGDE